MSRVNGILIIGVAAVVLIIAVIALALIGRWVYKDAKAKGLQAGMWAAIAILVPCLIGLLIYCVYRSDKKPLMRCKSCERNIEMNVSFCPYCGYQSPPVREPVSQGRISKKMIALICLPVCLMFFGILAAGMLFVYTNRTRLYYRLDAPVAYEEVIEYQTPESWYDEPIYYEEASPSYYYEYMGDVSYEFRSDILTESKVIEFTIPRNVSTLTCELRYSGAAEEPSIYTLGEDFSLALDRISFESRTEDGWTFFRNMTFDVSQHNSETIILSLEPKTDQPLYEVYINFYTQ